MAFAPDLQAFEARYRQGQPQVVWTKSVADLETPVSAMLKIAAAEANAFLLESVEGGHVRGRYSIVGMKPDLIWRCRGDKAEINRRARCDANAFVAEKTGAVASLKRLVRECHIDLPDELPPMAAALVGYVGYEMVRLIERLPTGRPRAIDVPDGLLLRPTVMAIFDNVADEVTIVTPVRPTAGIDPGTAYAQACQRLGDASAALDRTLPRARGQTPPAGPAEAVSNTSRARFLAIVQKAKDYIAAGDAFQVVLSQRFDMPFALPPFAYYRALRRVNPSPFLFYLNFGGFAVVGSSPEILVRARDKRITIRPLAGTRRRGADKAEDAALGAELLADAKERAEHLMLLDLGRNDAGRVARIGSVKVTESFQIEYYSHVMHISSNVEAELEDGFDAIDALMAGFPAGTVSGAPKVRAMEIIDELESERRGVYAGAIGYFSADGGMDTCIALRTAVIKDGILHIQAGAGIVADSDPQAEHQECHNKARALLRAAEEAYRFADAQRADR